MMDPRFDRTFTAAEAEEIIRLSTQLQAEWNEKVTVTDIEAVARERGVDPHFVHMALAQRTPPFHRPRVEPASVSVGWSYRVLVAIYAVVLLVAMIAVADYRVWGFGAMWLVYLAAALLGAAIPEGRLNRTVFIPALCTVATTVVALVIQRVTHGYLYSLEYSMSRGLQVIVIQTVCLIFGYMMSRGGASVGKYFKWLQKSRPMTG
jgi:hypothetical protein